MAWYFGIGKGVTAVPEEVGTTGALRAIDHRLTAKDILVVSGGDLMEIHADLMDAHMYAFNRSVLHDVLNQEESFQSLRCDVLPYLVRSQLRSELLSNGAQSEENSNGKDALQNSKILISQLLANASTPSFHEIYPLGPAPILRKTHKCCSYNANKSKYCARLNSIQAFSDINRDVVGDANHLSSCTFSDHWSLMKLLDKFCRI
ncbi:hypothetical protein BUALT_Bualt02G0172000 [Buddleja alternifolia]|uniref:Uncharacterized protein n=1 Tax=Buddleja alternifolia TaxID=168488 RepID=A0AAV6Y753_9LAMI|nr:hypothetical protein BUALT_Bualt02G0172000 [Buddleja alternifolia]